MKKKRLSLFISGVFFSLLLVILLLNEVIGDFWGRECFLGICLAGILVLDMWKENRLHQLYTDQGCQPETMDQEEDHFRELLLAVRMRQHEFNNHLTAIFSAHYTCKTYEQLVQAQRTYWEEFQWENRYNRLLLIEDRRLAGFLYGKLQELEEKGIVVECNVQSSLKELQVSICNMVEILGIFIDNAAEAILGRKEEKYFCLWIRETKFGYHFLMRNPCQQVSYEEIAGWFKQGQSSKGKNRGLGLYYAKKLCHRFGGIISYEKMELEGLHWIEFGIEIQKHRDKR